jgi:hypothetical protein
MEGVLQAPDEVLGRLSPDDFAVGLSGVAQHDAEQPRPASLAFLVDHRRRAAEVDLGLFARADVQTADRQRIGLPQALQKPTDARIAGGELMIVANILEDPHPAEPLLKLGQDHLPKWLASIRWPRTASRSHDSFAKIHADKTNGKGDASHVICLGRSPMLPSRPLPTSAKTMGQRGKLRSSRSLHNSDEIQ